MSSDPGQPGPGGPVGAPSEEELRAAYEAELSRITVADVVAQSTVTLLNLAARRIAPPAEGAQAGQAAPGQTAGAAAGGRDLDQARDAIDAVRALLEILERRMPAEVRPLRDALSRLQMAYAAELRASPGSPTPGAPQEGSADAAAQGATGRAAPDQAPDGDGETGEGGGEGQGGDGGQGGPGGGPSGPGGPGGQGGPGGPTGPGGPPGAAPGQEQQRGPGPAESSGRLWVPGR